MWFIFYFYAILLVEGIVCYLTEYAFGMDGEIYSLLFITANTILFIIIISQEHISKSFFMVLLGGILFRLIVLELEYIYPNVFIALGIIGRDDVNFTNQAIMIYHYGYDSIPFDSYTYFVGTIFNIWGPYELIGRFINILFSVSSSLILYFILIKLEIKKYICYIISTIFLFMPFEILLSTAMLREAVPTFFVALSAYYFIQWMKLGNLKNFVFSILIALIAMLFHSGLIGVILGYFLIYMLYSPKNKEFNINGNVVLKSIFIVLLFILFITISINTPLMMKFQVLTSESQLTSSSEIWSQIDANTLYLQWLPIYNDIIDMIWQSPIRAFYFIFSPLPWDIHKIQDVVILFFDSSLYILSFALFFKQKAKLNNFAFCLSWACIITFVITSMIFGLGTFNYGTAIRHRSKFMIFMFIIIAEIINRQKTDND